jgi:hypothetical protein
MKPIVLSAIMLNVVMPLVVAPSYYRCETSKMQKASVETLAGEKKMFSVNNIARLGQKYKDSSCF